MDRASRTDRVHQPWSDRHGGSHVFKCRHDEIGVVLLDVWMPGLNGIEACRLLRKLDPAMPICFMSGNYADEISADVREFQNVIPTSENILRVIEDRLAARWHSVFPGARPRLDSIRLRETRRNLFELKAS